MNAFDFNTRKNAQRWTLRSMSPWPYSWFRDEYTRTDERFHAYQGRLRRIQRQITGRLSGIEGDDEKLMKLMNENLEKLIEKNDIIKTEYLAYEDAKRACGGHLPKSISPTPKKRLVIVTGH